MAEIGEANNEITNYTLGVLSHQTFPHPTGPKGKYKLCVFQHLSAISASPAECMPLSGSASPTAVGWLCCPLLCAQFIDGLSHSEDEEQHEQSQGQNQQPNNNQLPCFEAMDEETKEIVRDAVKEEIEIYYIEYHSMMACLPGRLL